MRKVACFGFAMQRSGNASSIRTPVERMEELALMAQAKISQRSVSFTVNILKA